MATVAAKGMTKDQIKMHSDFVNLVEAREYTKGVVITKLVQTYTPEGGYEIELVEHPAGQEPTV